MSLLKNYPKLSEVTHQMDSFLRKAHPEFFGDDAIRPFLPLKRKKIIHDTIWGTFSFSWRELAVLDTPLLQRLRDIHQVGLAYQVYPSARHSRLEHSLGVLVMASRLFDALVIKHRNVLLDTVRVVYDETSENDTAARISQLKDELRLAALLHDVGHSLHSHASERVYGKLTVLKEAAEELSSFVGKRKGAGEVISFCFTLAPCLARLLERSRQKVLDDGKVVTEQAIVDLENVALMIVGRAKHPELQFLGDIISSDIDADKLDYLLRDSFFAGLPLRYDVDMFMYSAFLQIDSMADNEEELQRLYESVGAKGLQRHSQGGEQGNPYFEARRLRLPKRAMHVFEQLVICKMMLYSYVYHHPKVRAAEGLLERMLDVRVEEFRKQGLDDWAILQWFLESSDAQLIVMRNQSENAVLKEGAYRLVNRLLPREVIRLSASETTGAHKALLSKFLKRLHDKDKGKALITELEMAIGEELAKSASFRGLDWSAALAKAGAWLDVPKAPRFEDTQKIIGKETGGGQEPAGAMFPVHAWQHAYTSYRYYVRIYAYSEYGEIVKESARSAMKRVVHISDDGFYRGVERKRF